MIHITKPNRLRYVVAFVTFTISSDEYHHLKNDNLTHDQNADDCCLVHENSVKV